MPVRAVMLCLVLLAACRNGAAPAPEESQSSPTAAAPPAARDAAADAAGVGSGASQSGAPRPAPTQAADPASGPMLIRTGDASVEVDSLEPAVESLRALASRVGGFVANTSFSGGRHQVREATLQLRIPAARFEEAHSALAALGTVEWANVTAQDVGEEYVDLTARSANARRLEERLVDLLARRTGKLEDVLAVERELARVREEIERHEGRLRYLRTRVATSTFSVRLHEPAPVIPGRGSSGVIGEAFRQAWRNFVGAVATLIAASGVLMPVAVVAAAAWIVMRRRRKA